MDATIKELCQRKKNPLPFLWKKNDSGARKSWDVIRRLNEGQRALMQALVERQRASASQMHGCVRIPAKAIAPFTTGLGNAHPLENGFAFLWPYGLPYLAGSGVKGVVRRAAQELAHGMWENSRGWSKLGDPCFTIEYRSGKEKRAVGLSVIDVLFGRAAAAG
ncbi:MAG: hypothetical protein RML56_12230 [Burkholderiales bacterium]|nr:hypothetical protein [Burkholderiales bacterium]